MRGGVASDSSAQVHPLRLRRTGRGAGGVREVVSPGGNVMGRAPDTHVPTHAQGKRRVPGAQGRPRAGGREALSVSGRAEGREESPTVAAEGRFYGSHAGPNAAGRRAREPLALRGSPERGRLRVRAAPSAPCGRPAPGAPRDRRPRGSGRRRGEGTRPTPPPALCLGPRGPGAHDAYADRHPDAAAASLRRRPARCRSCRSPGGCAPSTARTPPACTRPAGPRAPRAWPAPSTTTSTSTCGRAGSTASSASCSTSAAASSPPRCGARWPPSSACSTWACASCCASSSSCRCCCCCWAAGAWTSAS